MKGIIERDVVARKTQVDRITLQVEDRKKERNVKSGIFPNFDQKGQPV